DDVIRTASIGIGKRGTTVLGQALRQPNVRVTAICDIDPKARDAAQTLAARDNPQSYSDWREVIDLKNVDAVIVATPCYLHAPMATACPRRGQIRILREASRHHAGAGEHGVAGGGAVQGVFADR